MTAPDLTPNHPAVEAAAREVYVHDAPSNDPQTWPPTPTALADDYRGAAFDALTTALPHLDAATEENLARLRGTPVGRALMAEGWVEGVLDHMGRRRGIMSSEVVSIIRERIADANPYREGVDHE